MSNTSTAPSSTSGQVAVSKLAVSDVFHDHFTESEQRELMAEDLEAQTGVSMILGALVFCGMMLGITSVLLIFWLKV